MFGPLKFNEKCQGLSPKDLTFFEMNETELTRHAFASCRKECPKELAEPSSSGMAHLKKTHLNRAEVVMGSSFGMEYMGFQRSLVGV